MKGYSVKELCRYAKVTRSAYYRWLKRPKSDNELRNEAITTVVKSIHENHPDIGYLRIRDELAGHYDIDVNDKQILRICRSNGIQSTIKWKPKSCTKVSQNPDHMGPV